MKFTAIIPVKGNSSRLPYKNILPLGDESLLTRKIRQVKESKIANRIIVSSDSKIMLEMARNLGVETDLRPKDLVDESRPFSDLLAYFADIVKEGHFVYTCATSPFFDENLMRQSKEKYLFALENNYDSLIAIYKFRHFLLDEKGPFNFKPGKKHLNLQDLKPFDFFTNGIIYTPVENIAKFNYFYGPNPFRFEVGQKEALDIDTKEDYLSALAFLDEERLLKKAYEAFNRGGNSKCLTPYFVQTLSLNSFNLRVA